MKKTEKKAIKLKYRIILLLAASLGPWLIRFFGFSCRYTVEGEEHFQAALAHGKGVILALWHGRMLVPVYHHRHQQFVSLVSLHMDGEIITRIVRKLGYTIRRGSPREGGREGFMEMLRDLKAGRKVAIFPDGPTGPIHTVHDGVIHLSRLSNAPIVPMIYSAKPCWRARSWDKFMIPKPFSKGVIKYGPPIYIPRRIDKEEGVQQYRDLLTDRLNQIEAESDSQMDNT